MNMFLVEKFAKALSKLSSQKLSNAKKRHDAAVNKLIAAQKNLDDTNADLQLTQAGILAQLTRLNTVNEEVQASMALNESKTKKLKALIDADFQD
jgi:hypothetical protein